MINLIYRLGLGLFVLILLTYSKTAFGEKRVALVIGNGAYEDAPLVNPVHDAEDMARAVVRYGFTTMKHLNVDRKEMRRAIRRFGQAIGGGGVGLFYYAGHGLQVDGENYLVPIGATVYAADEIQDECLRASAVLRKMETAGNRLNIIILDACRNNPFARRFRSATRGLARMDAPAGSILAYATAPGSVAADGEGRNGLYTDNLLKHMQTPNLEIGQLFRRVRSDVMSASGGRQVPWESSSLTGSFYFSGNKAAAPDDDAPRPGVSDVSAGRENKAAGDGTTPGKTGAKLPPSYEDAGKTPQNGKERNGFDPPAFQTGNTARRIPGKKRWDWTVYITGSEADLSHVKCVEYTLHPTFPNPVRTVCNRGFGAAAFPLSTNGWGTFTVGIRIFLKNGRTINLSHPLRFR